MSRSDRSGFSPAADPWYAVLQSLGDAVIAADIEGRVTYLNPAAEALTGWRQADALGQEVAHVYNVIEERTGKAIERILADIAKGGEVVAVKVDMVLVDKTGTGTSVSDTAAPVRDGEQQTVGVVVVFRDVTEERQARHDSDEARERLQRAVIEAHHRAKNSLGLVAALVELQADDQQEPVPAGAARTLALRIRTLARIHALLSDGAGADQLDGLQAREALATLVPMLQATVMPRLVQFTGEQVRLPARYTTALSLITNELVTNAIKNSAGDVDVDLSVTDRQATLEVRDHGPGFAAGFDVGTHGHTGLGLVERMARHDLQGHTFYDTHPEGGGRARIVFPVPPSTG